MISAAAALLLLAAVSAQADWEVVQHRGADYVTLRSFCDFYGLARASGESSRRAVCQNAQATVTFSQDSRECWYNGKRYWLSLGTAQTEQGWLVSKTDVIKLFDPLLRPHAIEPKKPVQGVVIDPGHGGSDNGAISRARKYEKTYTLDTAKRLEAVLKAAGIRTVLTRRTDVFVDLYERAKRAALYPDYIFVSIHYNSADASARGIETYACSAKGTPSTSSGERIRRSDYQRLPGNANDAYNALLASAIHREITGLNPNDAEGDRGLKRARFVVLKQCQLPGVLVEGGFLSNRQEAARIETPEYRQALAESIARGILKYSAWMSGSASAATASAISISAPAPTRTPAAAAPQKTVLAAPAEPEPPTVVYHPEAAGTPAPAFPIAPRPDTGLVQEPSPPIENPQAEEGAVLIYDESEPEEH